MTNSNPLRDAQLDALADFMLNADHDHDLFDLLDSARSFITADAFRDLLPRLDLCPMHECDDAICADDDNAECAHLR